MAKLLAPQCMNGPSLYPVEGEQKYVNSTIYHCWVNFLSEYYVLIRIFTGNAGSCLFSRSPEPSGEGDVKTEMEYEPLSHMKPE